MVHVGAVHMCPVHVAFSPHVPVSVRVHAWQVIEAAGEELVHAFLICDGPAVDGYVAALERMDGTYSRTYFTHLPTHSLTSSFTSFLACLLAYLLTYLLLTHWRHSSGWTLPGLHGDSPALGPM